MALVPVAIGCEAMQAMAIGAAGPRLLHHWRLSPAGLTR
jgi:hypothetical protein